jgi:hypothetical protein
MNRSGIVIRLFVIAIVFFLLLASAGNAIIEIDDGIEVLNTSFGSWEDSFNDTSNIDPNPPGSGISDNYEVSGGIVKMSDTYPAWTDLDWNKMRIITVTNNAGQTLSGYALDMIINYDTDMQSDYDDLRFKHDDDTNTYIGYWIESFDSTSAQVWINIPLLPIGSSEVYMFYGNPSATGESSFGSVFTDWNEEWSDDEKITNHLDNEGTWDSDVSFDNDDTEFIVAWEEGQAYYPPYTYGFKQEIRASVYDSTGTKLVNDKLIFKDSYTYYRNEDPSIAYGNGKYFVAWEHYEPKNLPPYTPDISTMDIYAATVERSGNALSVGSIKYVSTATKCQADPNVAFDSINNRFLVIWEDARDGTSDYDIRASIYTASGVVVVNNKLISNAVNSQCEPWATFDPVNQQYMIVWEDGVNAATGPFDIYACRFDTNLDPIGSPQKIADGSSNTDYNFPCSYYNSETDEFLITWNDGDISESDWWGNVWGRILDSSGNTVKNNFIISSGEYVRTDIKTYSMSDFDDPYFVTYDNNNVILGKFVTADGEPSSSEVQLSISSDPDMKADWANMDIGDGKIFVAWEDIRDDYPSQYDFFPDVYGNLWELGTESGLSVSYSVGSEKEKVILAHVTSIEISKPQSDYWNEFNAIGDNSGLEYSILDGSSGDILVPTIDPDDLPYSLYSLSTQTIRVMATFDRSSPATTPELDYWSVTWTSNSPPNNPSNPYPTNGATNIGINEDLSWTCSDPDGDLLTYDVYFGTSNPPPLQISGQSATTYDPGTMNFGTIYYWKIEAFDNHGASAEGPVWSFTTWVNNPPNIPTSPNPADGATNVDLNADLSWTCSDPDGDILTFDIYFASINPPFQVVWNQTGTTYDPGALNLGTSYYWKIVAWDPYDASATGPLWSFTTIGNDPPNTPSNPNPTDGETGVDVNVDLSWDCSDPNGDDLEYDIYHGTTSPPNLKVQGYEDTTWDPGPLFLETKYFWKIVARDTFNAETEGPIWDFTTGANDPPYIPSNPDPADMTVDIPLNYRITWDGGDPNSGDTINYDLYFDTDTPPGLFKHDLTESWYDITEMTYETIYYWKIVSKDNHGATTEGSIWTFTTEQGEDNFPPSTPIVKGKIIVQPFTDYDYTVRSIDPEGEQIFYRISWGDEVTDWAGPFNSGEETIFTHAWATPMTPLLISVSAKDINGNKCAINGYLPIFCPRDTKTNILYRILERLLENPLSQLLLSRLISIFPIFGKIITNIGNS